MTVKRKELENRKCIICNAILTGFCKDTKKYCEYCMKWAQNRRI